MQLIYNILSPEFIGTSFYVCIGIATLYIIYMSHKDRKNKQ